MHFPLNNQMGNAFCVFYVLFMYGSKGYLLVLFHIESFHSRIYCACAEFFFDTEKLVVFCNTFGSAWSSGLDLAGVQCYCKVCDCCILLSRRNDEKKLLCSLLCEPS